MHHRRRQTGFTFVELLAAMSVAGVLSGLAWPTFQGALQKSRRADALVALTQAQAAQERWRFNQRSYGSLAQIGVSPTTTGGHYALAVTQADADRYVMQARAIGSQAGDRACRLLRLTVDGAMTTRSSGPDDASLNDAAANRRCWGL
ncbi:MAG: prepilin-type N-terminal cleavage/methylation domain-containing protein [Piscinibacter sp.]|uniref:type IV pilin protein n=1 Tax=Piscinibacter sp. TaxID=1903157 RepID=UPI002585C34E|nr:type IV pilin protein [Piscinibacter sp.]MCW5664464.1 prepilin-type N-terminal cleavage/methylation domain-containing protein [Piscinibacter sp.]